MNSRRRIIDPDRELIALERIPGHLVLVGPVGLDIGQKGEVIMAIMDAQVYGARVAQCCEMIGISKRTYERWKKRIPAVLNALGEVGVR